MLKKIPSENLQAIIMPWYSNSNRKCQIAGRKKGENYAYIAPEVVQEVKQFLHNVERLMLKKEINFQVISFQVNYDFSDK